MAMAVTYSNFGGQIVHENRGGVETDFVHDTDGSVVATLDANGNQTSSTEYWPFGEVASHTGSNPSPFDYIGGLGYYTDGSDQMYVGHRVYKPATAQWLTADTAIGFEPPYAYAYNSPTNFVDPSGDKPQKGKGPGLPKPLKGCLNAAAQSILAKKFADKTCANAIKSLCGES